MNLDIFKFINIVEIYIYKIIDNYIQIDKKYQENIFSRLSYLK